MQDKIRGKLQANPISLATEILESIPDAFYAVDADWRLTYINRKAEAYWHRRREDLLGRVIWEMFPNNEADEGYQKQLKSARERTPTFFEAFSPDLQAWAEANVYPSDDGGLFVYFRDITERKKTEEALKQSEEKYRQLFENMTQGFLLGEVILGSQGQPHDLRILEVNKAWEAWTQISRQEAIGKTYSEIMPGIPLDVIEKYTRVALTGQPAAFEFYSNFTQSWIDISAYSPAKGKFAAILTNITERKKAEEALRESEQKLQLMLESTPATLWTTDRDLRYTLSVGSGLRAIGLQPHEIEGKTMLEVMQPEGPHYPTLNAAYRALAGESCSYEVEYNGSYYYAHTEPLKDSQNNVIGTIGINLDITERKKAEDTLRKLNEKLESRVKDRTARLAESEEKYRSLVENANEAIIIVQDRVLKFFNKKALEISGYSREELAVLPFDELASPEDRDMIRERYRKLMQGEEVSHNNEFRIVSKDKRVKWVENNAVPINWEGRMASMGILTDITERKQMEQSLKDYARRITQVQEEERKRIAYELHDDTAQYLSILKLQLDSLLGSGKIQDPQVIEKLRYLEKDAGRAVDDVRRYSHELRPSVLEHMGLQAAIEQIAEDINKLKQFTVEVKVEGAEPELTEEVKVGLFRIAQETLNNIRKHSQASMATISLHFQPKQVNMIISDNGVGFNVQAAKNRSSLKGSLGLMSMQERATLIGANLKIESKPGQGACVILQVNL